MFSADYRAAVAAEAAGNVDVAAQRYALAGELDGAVRMHIARAARAATRQAEISALRDAVHWAGDEPALRAQATRALGRALVESARLEGIATERDRARVREAAELLIAGGDYRSAGEALEIIDDLPAAAQAYSAGGLIDKLEATLAKDSADTQRRSDEADAFKNYEVAMRVGRRDDARVQLARALAHTDNGGDYRRLIDQLDAAVLTGGRVELARRGKPALIVCAARTIVLGRDVLCDVPLRAGCVSRHHAEIDHPGSAGMAGNLLQAGGERAHGTSAAADHPPPTAADGGNAAFWLRDLGSRNGTTLAGLPLVGKVPLNGAGRFGLGEDCFVDYEVGDGIVLLTVATGVDRGLCVVIGEGNRPLGLSRAGLGLDVLFQNGRPLLGRGATKQVMFNGEALGDLRVQLIRGDTVIADGDEIRVA